VVRITPASSSPAVCARSSESIAPFTFRYVYDFGDNWEHEIKLEDRPVRDPQVQYPICLDGQRAKPPEDCGGVWGYQHLLEVLADPQHKEYREIDKCYGSYDPEAFSATETTRFMREGLPDWQVYDDVEI
jgi:hypothetical protein